MYRYETIANDLKQRIQSGRLPDGRLPSERALMQQFGVQRNTIRRALASLQADGLIVTESKRRATVAAGEVGADAAGAPAPALSGSVILAVEKIDESTARHDIERGLRQVFKDTRLSLLYFDTGQASVASGGLPSDEFLEHNDAAGLIVWPATPVDTAALRRVRRRLPVVLVDRRALGFEADFVGFDDEGGGRLVTETLLKQGRRRIGFLTGEIGAETVEGRWRGYRLALEAAGIYPDPALALQIANLRQLPISLLHRYLEAFVAQDGEPLDAVVCTSDSTAVNLIHFLRATGRRIPDDVAVVGYGDLLPDYLRALGLTTVAQTFVDIGVRAGEIMLRRLLSPPEPLSRFEEVRLGVRLVVRESCGVRERALAGAR